MCIRDREIPDVKHPIETMFQSLIDKIIPASSNNSINDNSKILMQRLMSLEEENKTLKEELSKTKKDVTESKVEIKELKEESETKYTIYARCVKEFITNNYVPNVSSKVSTTEIRNGVTGYLFKKGFTIQPFEIKKAMSIAFPQYQWIKATYNGVTGYYYSGLKQKGSS